MALRSYVGMLPNVFIPTCLLLISVYIFTLVAMSITLKTYVPRCLPISPPYSDDCGFTCVFGAGLRDWRCFRHLDGGSLACLSL